MHYAKESDASPIILVVDSDISNHKTLLNTQSKPSFHHTSSGRASSSASLSDVHCHSAAFEIIGVDVRWRRLKILAILCTNTIHKAPLLQRKITP